jgi:hypothetical protein
MLYGVKNKQKRSLKFFGINEIREVWKIQAKAFFAPLNKFGSDPHTYVYNVHIKIEHKTINP